MIGRYSFLVGAGIWLFGALIHWIAPLLGADWYAFLHSPEWVVDSARNSTWEAPFGAVVIGGLMFACALYALAGAGMIRRIPLLKTALVVISAIAIIRGLLPVPWLISAPERLSSFDIVGSLIWLLAGLSFLLGTASRWRLLATTKSVRSGEAGR